MLAIALVAPGSAAAQSGDPAEGSPSGVIYEIPLDNARQDAAPTRKTGRGSGGDQGSRVADTQDGTVSAIRSENGFGSSSTVPGAATVAKPRAKSGGTGGDGGTSGSRANGTGAQTSHSGSTSAAAAESLGAPRTATVTPSKSRAYVLLLLALIVAAGLGLAGRYVARRR